MNYLYLQRLIWSSVIFIFLITCSRAEESAGLKKYQGKPNINLKKTIPLPGYRELEGDHLTTSKKRKVDPYDMFSGSETGALLSQYLKTTVEYTEGAARRQRIALLNLQNARPELKESMVAEITAAYGRLDQKDYDKRWLLIDTLGQLKLEKAIPFLAQIAVSNLPPKLNNVSNHEESTRDEEVSIRLAAVNGLSYFSLKNPNAKASLLDIIQRASVTAVQRKAIRGYLGSPGNVQAETKEIYLKRPLYKERVNELKKILPKSKRRLIEQLTYGKSDFATPDFVRNAVKKTDKKIQKDSSFPTISK